MLLPASVVGVAVFFYGLLTLDGDIPSKQSKRLRKLKLKQKKNRQSSYMNCVAWTEMYDLNKVRGK